MIKVKALIDHDNSFGMPPFGEGAFHKKKGDSYELPEADAAALIEQGLVEAVDGKAAKPASK